SCAGRGSSCMDATARCGGSVAAAAEHPRQHETGNRGKTDRETGALADHLARVLAQIVDALAVELYGGFLQAPRGVARIVAILRAELLVDRRGVLGNHPAERRERFARLGLALGRELPAFALGLAAIGLCLFDPVFRAALGLITVGNGTVGGFRLEGRRTRLRFLERRVEARLRLRAVIRRRGCRHWRCRADRGGSLGGRGRFGRRLAGGLLLARAGSRRVSHISFLSPHLVRYPPPLSAVSRFCVAT